MIKKYNIAKPENYIGKDNIEKTIWHNVGTMTEFIKEGGQISRILEIPAIGLKANIFSMEKKSDNKDKEFDDFGKDTPPPSTQKDVEF